MARIIENINGGRRTIKLSVSDIVSIVREYQQIVANNRNYDDICSILEDNVIFVPEDVWITTLLQSFISRMIAYTKSSENSLISIKILINRTILLVMPLFWGAGIYGSFVK